MPRTYKSKNVHTKKELAGEQNMPEKYKRLHSSEEGETDAYSELFKICTETSKRKRGFNWSPEDLRDEINKFFQWCDEKNVKPAKVGISLWLGCTKETVYEWSRNPQKYGELSDLINMAFNIIEMQYISRAEKYPTANLFLLRTSHGHVEQSKLDITTNGNSVNDASEVKDLISKLGLDKQK